MMLNTNLKLTAVMLITKKILLLILGHHISHKFIIHIDRHNCYEL